jgi:GxxExxY protein
MSMFIEPRFNELTGRIIGAAIEVHRVLGPGLLESSYVPCLHHELAQAGLRFEAQRIVPVVYKGVTLSSSYRVDLIVEDLVVVEVKSIDRLVSVHEAQLLTYLRLTRTPMGLLMNFNVPRLTDGIKRLVNARYASDARMHSESS